MDILDKLTNKDELQKQLDELERKIVDIDFDEIASQLKSKVIGQDHAAEEVVAQVRRRMAARRPDKPIAVFCFAGPPGVGKTYFAKILAENLFGDAKYLVFMDMTQYNQPHSAATLFGMTKGYVGSDTYGVLTSALKNCPNAIVLLDEFEKCHTEVRKRFLTAWNDGFITEASDGSQISTAQAIFILTTNAAAKTIGELTKRFENDPDELVRASISALEDEGGFAPEILSRIDRIFSFAPLAGLDVARVVALEIEKLVKQFSLELAEGGIDVNILMGAIKRQEKLAVSGVRELTRAIENQISDSLIDAKNAGAAVISLVDNEGVVSAEIVKHIEGTEPT